jgi:hypothetical protein
MSESPPENVQHVAIRHHQRAGYFVPPLSVAFILLMSEVPKKFQFSREDSEPRWRRTAGHSIPPI